MSRAGPGVGARVARVTTVVSAADEPSGSDGVSMAPYLASRRKRALDVVVSAPLCVALAPLLLILAIGSFVTFRSWPFFWQSRVGLDGDSFAFVKIRSLPVSTHPYTSKYDLRAAKVPRFGAFLRRTHLDELPQIYLVLVGRMSLVGPRPEMASFLERYDRVHWDARTSVRPGCTGPWQLSSAADRLIAESPHFDLHYLTHASLRMDVALIWKTVVHVASRR